MKIKIILLLLLTVSLVTGQVTVKVKQQDLSGSWYCCNKNSHYYKADTVYLYSSPLVYDCCDEVVWWIKKNSFRKYTNSCGVKFKDLGDQKIYTGTASISKKDSKNYLTLTEEKEKDGKETFEIINLQLLSSLDNSNTIIKRLILIRRDNRE